MKKSRCSAKVWEGWDKRQCRRAWAVEEEGCKWCKQHAPSVARARRLESEQRQEQKMQRRCPKCGHAGQAWEFYLPWDGG